MSPSSKTTMKPESGIIRESIDPAWAQAGVRAGEALADHAQDHGAWQEVQLEAERAAGEERYLEGLIAEARAIVAGTSDARPQAAHLGAVLDRLDRYAHRRRPQPSPARPHPQGRVRRLLARAALSRPTQTGHPTIPPPSAPTTERKARSMPTAAMGQRWTRPAKCRPQPPSWRATSPSWRTPRCRSGSPSTDAQRARDGPPLEPHNPQETSEEAAMSAHRSPSTPGPGIERLARAHQRLLEGKDHRPWLSWAPDTYLLEVDRTAVGPVIRAWRLAYDGHVAVLDTDQIEVALAVLRTQLGVALQLAKRRAASLPRAARKAL